MKKIVILLCVLLLVGCTKPNIEGSWLSENGQTNISFEGDGVIFISSEGTYEVKDKTLIMKFEGRELVFEYTLDDDFLTLEINDSKIILHRQ